jgi:hypothetical protein
MYSERKSVYLDAFKADFENGSQLVYATYIIISSLINLIPRFIADAYR